ncbi:erythromycin esterase family protein [Streptomyces sp. NPDC006140]|uniref:erythromycin esterase family protein n=1 Tax=Streptomyces sp. NPDC006140 TaxID=3154579 RepID=UPI0033FA170A
MTSHSVLSSTGSPLPWWRPRKTRSWSSVRAPYSDCRPGWRRAADPSGAGGDSEPGQGMGRGPDPQRRLVQDAEELLGFLRERRFGAADALRHARILVQAADLVTRARQHTDPEQTVFAVRDRYMAEAVGGILNDPSTKVSLWAHNGHITKSRHGGSVPATG